LEIAMRVSEYMTRKLITGKPNDGIRETFFLLRREKIRHLPVVDDDHVLVGIVSDRDLRRPDWVDEAPDLSHEYRLDDDLALGDIMSTNLVVVHTYDPVRKATQLLIEHGFGALPVLDKESKLVGMLSALDLLVVLEQVLAQES
jgi:acetoin utilization protein AcuB